MLISPSVSIILPTYNAARFLPRAITTALQQTHEDFELLVLDNASTDSTPDIVRDFQDRRLRYIQNSVNLGMVENINRGIDIAAAPRAVILCADDYWQSSFLERVLAMNYGRAELLFTNCTVLQGGNEILNLNVHHGYDVIPPWRLIRHLHGIPLSSLMFPISGHKQRFDTRLPFNCDLEFVLRCMLKERFALRFLDWPGVFVGLHDANETSHYDIRRENIKLLDIVSEYDVGHSVRLAILAKKWRLLLG